MTMHLVRVTIAMLTAAGCADAPAKGPLRGAQIADGLGSSSIEDHDPHECSYEETDHNPHAMPPDRYQQVTRTYDADGLVAMRQAVDGSGATLWTETNEYN